MTVAGNLASVLERIDLAARRAGRDPSGVTLVAVSKMQPSQLVREAYEAGQRHFGESYAQELVRKRLDLEDLAGAHWHFIGHLQRNKVRKVVGSVHLLETADSQRLLDAIDQAAAERGLRVDVLLEVGVAGEEQKSGCSPAQLGELLAHARGCERVRVRGLMAIPPFPNDPEESRPYFAEMRRLREAHGGADLLPELSMGMSDDFEVAVEEGATIVRVGTAIFGPRRS